jgi:hypothetical protein
LAFEAKWPLSAFIRGAEETQLVCYGWRCLGSCGNLAGKDVTAILQQFNRAFDIQDAGYVLYNA